MIRVIGRARLYIMRQKVKIMLQIQLKGVDIKRILSERASFHEQQVRELSEQFKALSELQNRVIKNFGETVRSNAPASLSDNFSVTNIALAVSSIQAQISNHSSRSRLNKLFSENLNDGEQYTLDTNDFILLGLIDSQNSSISPEQTLQIQQVLHQIQQRQS